MEKQKYLPLVIAIAVIPIMICGLVVWLPMRSNNLRLKQFVENLYEYPLPPDTIVLNRRAGLSKVGNGNNCSYEVQQSMVSALPRDAIERYYEDVMLPRVSFGAQYDGVYDSRTVTRISLEFDEDQTNEAKSFFTLSLFDVGLDVSLMFGVTETGWKPCNRKVHPIQCATDGVRDL